METTVEEVAVAELRLTLERPLDPEALLDEDAFDRDEFMPYWAEVWPSGLALARHVAGLDLTGLAVLELGCGLGLPSLVASLRGANVVASDWAADALMLLKRNARRNRTAVETLRVDWREAGCLEDIRFDVVLAADVLYEERNVRPLLELLPRIAGGRVLIADPGRRHAAAFLQEAPVSTLADPLLPRGGIHLVGY